MAVTKIKPIKSTLSKALDYIQNPDKTDGKTLVFSFGCSYETADIEFEYTLSQARQKGNNLAFHLIQSFEPGEVDCEKAHTIGKQLAAVMERIEAAGIWLPEQEVTKYFYRRKTHYRNRIEKELQPKPEMQDKDSQTQKEQGAGSQ